MVQMQFSLGTENVGQSGFIAFIQANGGTTSTNTGTLGTDYESKWWCWINIDNNWKCNRLSSLCDL